MITCRAFDLKNHVVLNIYSLFQICGALAEEGKGLEEIVEFGKRVTENMGALLSLCHI